MGFFYFVDVFIPWICMEVETLPFRKVYLIFG